MSVRTYFNGSSSWAFFWKRVTGSRPATPFKGTDTLGDLNQNMRRTRDMSSGAGADKGEYWDFAYE